MCAVDEMLIFIFISSALVNFYDIVGNRGYLLSKQENNELYDKLMKMNDETSQAEYTADDTVLPEMNWQNSATVAIPWRIRNENRIDK